MKNVIKLFHYISFIKYPLMFAALYFLYNPSLMNSNSKWESMNTALIFMGLAIGLDSLKDYTKLSWIDKKIYHKPKIAKYYFIFSGIAILVIIGFGIYGYLSNDETIIKELSVGNIILGIGLIGILKSGIQATKDFIE